MDSESIALAIADVLRRRGAGEDLPDERVAAENPHLMPHLGDELLTLPRLRREAVSARLAGPTSGPLRILDQSALDAPIDGQAVASGATSGPDGRESASEAERPRIDGYVILDELGRGGQATVFRAREEETGRTVAVKVMLGGALLGRRHRERFEREVSILALISHPNVADVIGRGRTADGSFYCAMRYVDGVPLDRHVADRCLAKTDLPALLGLWVKVARAVDEAHRQGVTHRDLKPANILVDRRGEPHVVDFGLARGAGHLPVGPGGGPSVNTRTGHIVGSLPWASPEQAAGLADAVGTASDVYSLGVTFYQSLTGRFPYDVGGSITAVLRNIATATPVAPGRVISRSSPSCDATLARGLDAILLTALAKNQGARYATAGALADDLERCLRRESPVAVPARARLRWRRRVRPLAWAAVAIVAIASAGALGLAGRTDRRPPPAHALPAITNSLGMRLVRLSPGYMMMGSPITEDDRQPDERQYPVHILRPVYLGVTEVTRAQFRAVMKCDPSDSRWAGDDLPVQNVTWHQAAAFCQQLSAREGRVYRLPSEAEWEYACRAGTQGPFADNRVSPERLAWYQHNSGGHPHPVARLSPNAWGLFDMQGGVAEWCADAYVSAPWNGTRALPGGPTISRHVVRGGDFTQPAAACRAAARSKLDADVPRPTVGFRVALEDPTMRPTDPAR